MTLTVQGLVIRVTPYQEYDRLLSVLTEDQGKLFIKANAVRSITNPNAGACQLFAYSEFLLREKQDRYYVNRARLLSQPLGASCELSALALASYLSDVCDDVARDDEGARVALHLLMNALFLLRKNDRPVSLIKAVFELRLLSAVGFMPHFESCGECGTVPEKGLYFHLSDGTLLCGQCAKATDAIPISNDCAALAVRTIFCEEKDAYAVRPEKKLLQEFSAFAEQYLLAQLQRGFDTLDYYHKNQEET